MDCSHLPQTRAPRLRIRNPFRNLFLHLDSIRGLREATRIAMLARLLSYGKNGRYSVAIAVCLASIIRSHV
jgi:hypothetical protein